MAGVCWQPDFAFHFCLGGLLLGCWFFHIVYFARRSLATISRGQKVVHYSFYVFIG